MDAIRKAMEVVLKLKKHYQIVCRNVSRYMPNYILTLFNTIRNYKEILVR